ncbi:MAG: hypothetical protein K2P81_14570 [Bacteriovoracaceae bacterium]|nr:hypothetical protein [Bacteriovoracaceae bacterium]
MKILLFALLYIGSFPLFAATRVETQTQGYGGNEYLACLSAQSEAMRKLQDLCPYQNLENLNYSECSFESEGDYFVIVSIKVSAECI